MASLHVVENNFRNHFLFYIRLSIPFDNLFFIQFVLINKKSLFSYKMIILNLFCFVIY